MRTPEQLTFPIRVTVRVRLSSSEERYDKLPGWCVAFNTANMGSAIKETVAIVMLDSALCFDEFALSAVTVER